jgi:hypothetical protein
VTITDVAWARDHHGRPVLALKLDGHPASISSSQKTALTDLGIVEGVVFLKSERARQSPNPYIHGDYTPTHRAIDLVGCTDDPDVFALYRAMCASILEGTWREGAPTDPG